MQYLLKSMNFFEYYLLIIIIVYLIVLILDKRIRYDFKKTFIFNMMKLFNYYIICYYLNKIII